MHNIRTFLVNTLVLMLTVVIALGVATIAITRKVNSQNISKAFYLRANVQKEEIVAVSQTRGIVTDLAVRIGDTVKKGDAIALLDNPTLREKVTVLGAYQNNISAQTEASVLQNEIENLVVHAPAGGVIGELAVNEFDPVESLTKIATLYSNDRVTVLANVTDNEFQALIRSDSIQIYSSRLNQSFPVGIDRIRPYEEASGDSARADGIGIYFALKNPDDGADLLHNEVVVLLPWEAAPTQKRPADFFIDFWNGLLILPDKS